MKYLLILLAFFLFFSACADEQSAYQNKSNRLLKEQDNYEEASAAQNTKSKKMVERKIIRTANMRLQVEDLKTSVQRIETLVKSKDGFIANSNQRQSNYSINSTIILRLPMEHFDTFLAAVEQEAILITSKEIHADDVTEEYVDITSRLNTKKTVRDRYIEILRDKATTVTEVLDAEEKIRVLQEEIESTEGRLNYLNNRMRMSTITLNLYQEVAYVNTSKVYRKSYFIKLKEGFWNGWELVQGITIASVTIWPIWLLLIVLYFLRKRFWKS